MAPVKTSPEDIIRLIDDHVGNFRQEDEQDRPCADNFYVCSIANAGFLRSILRETNQLEGDQLPSDPQQRANLKSAMGLIESALESSLPASHSSRQVRGNEKTNRLNPVSLIRRAMRYAIAEKEDSDSRENGADREDAGKSSAVVFYSWQSDTPSKTNRNFILQCLESAVRDIKKDESISVEPVIDRDTQNVSGSPDIVATILDKISKCDAFVADVTIINKKKFFCKQTRPCPNPNVLLELGYALRTLGWNRIILVLNSTHGSVEQLPFDLNRNRCLVYDLRSNDAEKPSKKKTLIGKMRSAVKSILTEIDGGEIPQAPEQVDRDVTKIAIANPKVQMVFQGRKIGYLSRVDITFMFEIENLRDDVLEDVTTGVVVWACNRKGGLSPQFESKIEIRNPVSTESDIPWRVIHLSKKAEGDIYPLNSMEVISGGPFEIPFSEAVTDVKAAVYVLPRNRPPVWFQLDYSYWEVGRSQVKVDFSTPTPLYDQKPVVSLEME